MEKEKINMKYVGKTNVTIGGINEITNGCRKQYDALVDAFHEYMKARKEKTKIVEGKLEITIKINNQ